MSSIGGGVGLDLMKHRNPPKSLYIQVSPAETICESHAVYKNGYTSIQNGNHGKIDGEG